MESFRLTIHFEIASSREGGNKGMTLKGWRVGLPLAVAAALVSVTVAGATPAKQTVSIPAFTADQLSADAGDNWITHKGTLGATNHSSLTQINPSNVNQLQAAWHTSLDAPLVYDPGPGASASSSQTIAYNGVLYNEDTT